MAQMALVRGLRSNRTVDELGRKLRAAREKQGLTIEEIAARTKIGASKLRALEAGDLHLLPGDFYTRNFLRTYARELRLAPDDVVGEFDTLRQPSQPEIETPVGTRLAARTAEKDVTAAEPVYQQRTDRHPIVGKSNLWAGGIFSALVLMVLVTVWRQATPNQSPEAGALATAGVVEAAAAPAPAPVATSGRRDAAPGKLAIEIRPTADIWVSAKADGTAAIFRLLHSGERVTVEAANELAFRIGNASAFEYAINGVPGKPLGGPDQVREFTITRDNVRTYRR
jgi:cytoskeleton protein RodZ